MVPVGGFVGPVPHPAPRRAAGGKNCVFFPLMRRVTLHSVKTTAVRYHSLRSFLMLPPDLDFVLAFIKDAKQPATMEVFTEQAVIL